MGRSPCCEKAGLKRGKWSAEEDEKLVNYIKVNGEGSWRSLPTNAGLLRCGKSCRLRWINYLRSDVKRGNFTPQEDETIVKLHNTLGNRWSLIAGHLPGRTDNEIKNYWHTRLTRKIYSYRFVGESTLSAADMAKMVTKTKQKLGRSSNAAAKKHGEQAAGSKPKVTSTEQAPSSDCLPLAHAVPADPFGINDEGKSANLIDTVSSCNTLSTEGWPDALLQSPDDGHEMLGPLNEVDDEILMYLKYFLDDERHGIIMNTNKDFCGGWSSNLDL